MQKNGWSTTEMIALSSGILLALLVSVIFIYKLYDSMGESLKVNNYITMEGKLESAARDYIANHNVVIKESKKITLKTLMDDDLITEFNDKDGNPCNGYVEVDRIDYVNHYHGYIKCNDYESKNY